MNKLNKLYERVMKEGLKESFKENFLSVDKKFKPKIKQLNIPFDEVSGELMVNDKYIRKLTDNKINFMIEN